MLPVAITVGEPAGIGPDILIKLVNGHCFDAPIVCIANRELLLQRARQMGTNITLPDYITNRNADFSLLNVPLNAENNAEFVLNLLKKAVSGCQTNAFCAMVTAPVNKAMLKSRGEDFLGHTEYLAKLSGAQQTLMLFVHQTTRLGLLTTHIPLAEVPQQITAKKLDTTVKLLHNSLQEKFGINDPCIVVTGLNPHAGEQGHLGTEEQRIIIPALDALRQQGLQLIGPISADTAFHIAKTQQADAILSLYHDQLLPVMKTLGFGNVVNVTLGLPIIRTSVDHGTAIDLAGTGNADESSLVAATRLAIKLAQS